MKLSDLVRSEIERKPPRVVLHGIHKIGKALENTQPVLTPSGWVEISALKEGDTVCRPSGGTATVTGVFPQGMIPTYAVKTTHGKVLASGDHLWTVFDRNIRAQRTMTTLEMVNKTRSGVARRLSLPEVFAVEMEPAIQQVPPYLLGAWIGDGTKAAPTITNPDQEVQNRCISDAKKIGIDAIILNSDRCDRISIANRNNGGSANPFTDAIKDMGLYRIKSDELFIPKNYMFASKRQRAELFSALLDTDGYVSKSGVVQFYTVSPKLAKDFVFIAKSLGCLTKSTTKTGKYKKDGKEVECKECNLITVSLPNGFNPFTVERKKERVKEDRKPRYHKQFIDKIKFAGNMECTCITISTDDGLFITKDFIPTHNSTWAAGAPNPIFLQTEDGLAEIEVNHFPLAKSYDEALQYLTMLITEDHDYQTFVLDTADWLERLIWAKVCEDHAVNNIEGIGWGKGYTFAMQHWTEFINGMNRLRDERNMAIVVLAHNEIKTYNPPDGDSYDRYQIKMHKHAANTLEEWADVILFANWQTYVDSKNKKVVNRAERVIHTTSKPAWKAGSRYPLPETLPMDFNEFMKGIKNNG